MDILVIITDICDGLGLPEIAQEVSVKLHDHCNPSKSQELPFLFSGQVWGEHFSLNSGRFLYYGREKFRELYNAAKSMDYRNLFVPFPRNPRC
jgi:hypothetical protein